MTPNSASIWILTGDYFYIANNLANVSSSVLLMAALIDNHQVSLTFKVFRVILKLKLIMTSIGACDLWSNSGQNFSWIW